MSEFVPASHVLLGQSAQTVDEATELIAQNAVSLGLATDAAAVAKAIQAREAEGTTGMMGGFAIPHAKTDAVCAPGVMVVKFTSGIAWESMDKEPITCAIVLLNTVSGGAEHLRLLSSVAVLLMDEGFRSRIQASSDAAEIAAIVNEGLAGVMEA